MKSLLQTTEWGEIKKRTGSWSYFLVNNFQILEKNLFLGKKFLYIPEAASDNWQKDLTDLICQLKSRKDILFLKIEPLEKENESLKKVFKKSGFIPSFEEIQPKHRQWVSIDLPEEEILAKMRPKGRYNIKVALKHEVVIEVADERKLAEEISAFYKIFLETSARDQFSARPEKYFQILVKELYSHNLGKLYFASYQNQKIASTIITFYDDIASYLYGASSNQNRNVMAPYLLHWQAIKDAKKNGCKIYDLLAIAPEGNTVHKHAKLNQFKKQFGGESIELIGGWDYKFSPFWYTFFKIIQKLRRR